MENIVIVEKLCEKLQESDRPTDLGVAIALRVILDENITLEELRAEAVVGYSRTLKRNSELAQEKHRLLVENTQLKHLNADLEVKLETANKLLVLKSCDVESRTLIIPVGIGKSFKQATMPFEGLTVEDKMHSVYYQSAKKRAKRIWNKVRNTPMSITNTTKHILNWNTTFNLLVGEPIKYEHVEAACMPKCYGGLGLLVGMKLEKFILRKGL